MQSQKPVNLHNHIVVLSGLLRKSGSELSRELLYSPSVCINRHRKINLPSIFEAFIIITLQQILDVKSKLMETGCFFPHHSNGTTS